MQISVVIPCRNEEKYIEGCILSIINGTSKEFELEINIVDGMSTDRTRSIIKNLQQHYPFIKLIDNPLTETQIALNKGVKAASYPYIMIAGAHSSFPPQYIETLLHYIITLNADGAGGSLITKVLNKSKTSVAISKILAHPLGVGNSMFRIGASKPIQVDTVPFGIYKKSLFEEVGLYDEKLKRNHDMEWSKRLLRAGKIIYLIPETACVYYAREHFSALAKNNYRNGLWNILTVYYTKTFKSLGIRHFIPFIFVLSLIIPLIGSVWCIYSPLLTLLVIISYLLATTFAALKMERKGTDILHIIAAFFTIHFAYGLGSLVGLFHLSKLFSKNKKQK